MSQDRLYSLLPAVYRRRDLAQGEPLRALMALLQGELDQIEAATAQQYDNCFIETCEPWIVPHIARLLGIEGLERLGEGAPDPRALVARTLSYRRRKGTGAAIEQVIRDTLGWTALLVETLDLLGMTQHLRYPAPERGRIFDLGDVEALGRVGTPFESTPRTIEVRRIATGRGRYNIGNIALFLWRLRGFGVRRAPARPGLEPGTFLLHPLGVDTPLFHLPLPRVDPSLGVRPEHVPGPISRHALCSDLAAYRRDHGALTEAARPARSLYYGPGRSLQFVLGGVPVRPSAVVCVDLSAWRAPAAGKVAVDPALGRVALPKDEARVLEVDFATGFSADLGGGPYDRADEVADLRATAWSSIVRRDRAPTDLASALAAWDDAGRPDGVIRIADHHAHAPGLLALSDRNELLIEAGDGARPSLAGLELRVPPEGASLTLSGLQIAGPIRVTGSGRLRLELRHCTVVALASTAAVDLIVERSILGPITLEAEHTTVHASDCILDGDLGGGRLPALAGALGYGPPCTLERVTVFGALRIRELRHASEVIFAGPVDVERRQLGCVRYSYVPPGSRTPRRYRCQPDITLRLGDIEPEQILARLVPRFTSTRYGQPGYAQLRLDNDEGVLRGAEDSSELGAMHHLQLPQRQALLRDVLHEHMRAGMDVGAFFVT